MSKHLYFHDLSSGQALILKQEGEREEKRGKGGGEKQIIMWGREEEEMVELWGKEEEEKEEFNIFGITWLPHL